MMIFNVIRVVGVCVLGWIMIALMNKMNADWRELVRLADIFAYIFHTLTATKNEKGL